MADVPAVALNRYLSEALARPRTPQQFNCVHFVADWIMAVTGIDPMPVERAACLMAADERAARRIMRDCGGMAALFDRFAACVGGERVSARSPALPGDFGIVLQPYKRRRDRIIMIPVGAICKGGGAWAVKPASGKQLMVQPFQPIAVWTLPDGC